jgi:hypothetical protein
MNEVTEYDVQLARIVRNGLLAAVLAFLLITASCSVANWHYQYLDRQMELTRYLVTRPW